MIPHRIHKYLSSGKYKFLWISAGLGVSFWIIDSLTDFLLFNNGTIVSQLIKPSLHEAWMRLLIISSLIFGIFSLLLAIRHKRTEKTMLKNTENLSLYQALINQSNDSVEVLDPETGNFINVNTKTCTDLGYTREELLSMKVFDIDPLVKPSDFPKIMEELRRTGSSVWNGIHLRKDGTTFPVEVSLKYVQLDREYVVAVARDITERKRTEDALKESERRYRNLFDNANDLIQSIAPDGHILYVNPAWLKTLGYTMEDLSQMTVFDILHPDFRNRCMNTLQQVLSGESKQNIEAIFISKNGRMVNVEGTASMMMLDGKAVACNGIFRDVTDRKRMEEQLFQIRHDWEDTFNSITDMITVHDRDFNIIHANKAAEKILGLPMLNVSRTKCYQYYHGTGAPPEGCPSCDCLKTGLSSVNELYEPHLKMFIEIRAIPRFDKDNNLVGLIHVVRDITERRKLEDQLRQSQKMEAVGQLAGGIAHDFNNILTAVIGYSNILKMRMDKHDPLTVNIDHILSASDRGAHLTQSLLAFSRQQVNNPVPVNVNDLIKNLEGLLLGIIGENIKLTQVLTGNMVVMADRVQLDQVIMNLCANARDAMPCGGVLTIGTGVMELGMEFTAAYDYGGPGSYAVISVSDTGCGVDEIIKRRNFEPFFTTKEVGKGTGLGLSIVYGIVKQHNGYVTCNSEPGKGSTFSVYLPITKAVVSETKSDEITGVEGRSKTILLAEDEPAVRELTKQVLENYGYTVIEAVNGEEAVKSFTENMNKIDMIIFDVIMPVMNGKEAYERIRKMKPGIKALLTSGYPSDFIQKQHISRQGVAFIAKPVSPASLIRKVEEELSA